MPGAGDQVDPRRFSPRCASARDHHERWKCIPQSVRERAGNPLNLLCDKISPVLIIDPLRLVTLQHDPSSAGGMEDSDELRAFRAAIKPLDWIDVYTSQGKWKSAVVRAIRLTCLIDFSPGVESIARLSAPWALIGC